VLPVRIELTTSPLPRGRPALRCATTRQIKVPLSARFSLIYRHISPYCSTVLYETGALPRAVNVLSDRYEL